MAIPVGFAIGYGLAGLMSLAYDTELYRWPLVVSRQTYGFSVLIILMAALISGYLIRRQINQLDLVAVLKTRE